MNKIVFIAISIIFLLVCGWLGMETHSSLSKFQRYKLAYTSELNFQSSLLDIKDYINSGEWKKSNEEGTEKWKTAYRAKQKASVYGSILGGLILLYLGIFFLFYRIKKIATSQYGYVILHSSLVFLIAGISLPFLELGAYMEDLKVEIAAGLGKTFEGKMYFFYQSKTVLELIETLFINGSFVVGLAILVFSIVFPFTKLGLFYYYLLTPKMNHKKKLLRIASYVGKYSMADVFVAACFLAFLSFNNLSMGIKTESSVLIGLYFFLGYCVVSIATYFIIQQKIGTTEETIISSLDEKY